ncbi:Ricin-type beta-trefoil lectin domain-containing protein [Streptomyces sp. 1331.2]|nr:Ricin-type beta-trefoil lectin domain-containing protein [Streptomyces sp. 1331.2]
MCVDDVNAGTADGNPILLVGCNESDAQQLSLGSDGTVRVKGGCIAPVDARTAAGTPLEYRTCYGTSEQRWIPLANNALYHPASGRCFSLPPGGQAAGGTRLQLSDCKDEAYQQWSMPMLRTAALPAPPRS